MKDKYFFLTCILLLCIFLSGILIGATVAAKAQKELDRIRIEELTEKNLAILERVENLQVVIGNMLGLKKPTVQVVAGE